MSSFEEGKTIQVIELHMMDKRKYFPLAIVSGVAVRGLLYPVMLIKTRIQIQKRKSHYRGLFDAFRKISQSEGVRGLYKGFWVSNLLVVPQMAYITTYESCRLLLKEHTMLQSTKVRSFVSGGAASVVSQSFVVPIDIVTQHLMLITKGKKDVAAAPAAAAAAGTASYVGTGHGAMATSSKGTPPAAGSPTPSKHGGTPRNAHTSCSCAATRTSPSNLSGSVQTSKTLTGKSGFAKFSTNSVLRNSSHPSKMAPLPLPEEALRSNLGRTRAVIRAVYAQSGVRGFYKGYFTSLAVYAPSSAMWWFFYDLYSGLLDGVAPDWAPRLALQCIAAPMGGVTSAVITNPLDIVRARIQVENTLFGATTRALWREERLGIFTKGLSARLVQSVMFSFFIMLGYESIKRLSLREEYKDSVSW